MDDDDNPWTAIRLNNGGDETRGLWFPIREKCFPNYTFEIRRDKSINIEL